MGVWGIQLIEEALLGNSSSILAQSIMGMYFNGLEFLSDKEKMEVRFFPSLFKYKIFIFKKYGLLAQR